jgi:capsid protein
MGLGRFIPQGARDALAKFIETHPAEDRASDVQMAVDSSNVFGNPSSGYRSPTTNAPLVDLRDARPTQRKEAVKNSRFLRAKLGIVKALFENTSRYTLGRGLTPSSSCEDREWAKKADDVFYLVTSSKKFDIREDLTFTAMQKVILPDVMCDGDCGAAPVRDGEGRPRLQLFPSDAIGDHYGSGPSYFDRDGAKWNDGILRTREGTPVAYRILKDPRWRFQFPKERPYFDYPSAYFYHIGRADRINANRPLPWLHHGDQSAVNILDLNALEMAAAKLNSYFAACIKTVGGQVPEGWEDILSREDEDVATQDADGNSDTKTIERTYANLFGGAAIPVLDTNEELQFFNNARPSQTFAGFIDYLIGDIAVGFGIPKEFVWSLSGLAGPQARLVLQQADWFFADIADMLIADFCQPVWEGVIQDAMTRGILDPPAADTNWRAVQWQGPGSLTIDKGRDGKLHLDMIKSGLGRRSSWHEMTGKNGDAELRKSVEEIRKIMDMCDEMGVPHHYFFGKDLTPANGSPATPEEVANALEDRQQMIGEE